MKSIWWTVDGQTMLHAIYSKLSILDSICDSPDNAAKVRRRAIQISIQGVESKHHISKNLILVRDEQRGHGGADIGDPGANPAIVELEELRGGRRRWRGHGDDEPVGVPGGAERGRGRGEDGEGGEQVDGGEEEEEEGRGDSEDLESGVGLLVLVVIPESVGGGVLEMRASRGPRG